MVYIFIEIFLYILTISNILIYFNNLCDRVEFCFKEKENESLISELSWSSDKSMLNDYLK